MTSPRCDPHGRVMIWPRLHRPVPETGPTLPPLRGSGPFQIRAGVCRRAMPQLVRVLNESQAVAVPRAGLSRLVGRAWAYITNADRRIRGISVQHRIALERNQRTGQQARAARPKPDLAFDPVPPIRRSGRSPSAADASAGPRPLRRTPAASSPMSQAPVRPTRSLAQ